MYKEEGKKYRYMVQSKGSGTNLKEELQCNHSSYFFKTNPFFQPPESVLKIL